MAIIKIDKEELNKFIKKAKDKTADLIGEDNLKKINDLKSKIDTSDDSANIQDSTNEETETSDINNDFEINNSSKDNLEQENNAVDNSNEFKLSDLNKNNKRKSNFKLTKTLKLVILIPISIILVICVVFTLASIIPTNTDITLNHNVDYYTGKNLSSVKSELSNLGFKNIEVIELNDNSHLSNVNENTVETLYINGSTLYKENDVLPGNSEAIIIVHVTHEINPPYSSEDLKNIDIDQIANDFSKSGFINISKSEVYDLDPDDVSDDFISTVDIGYSSIFSKSDTFTYDNDVSIVKHYPYKKYTVNLNVNFLSNLLFSKYGIKLYLDDSLEKELEHAEDYNAALRLKEGKHVLKFVSKNSSSDFKEVELDVIDDMDIIVDVHTSEMFGLSADLNEIKYKTYLRDNEVRMTKPMSSYIGMNYDDAYQDLSSIGLNDISYDVEYDLSGADNPDRYIVTNITIGDYDSLATGDVIDRNTSVKLIYHLAEEDKPQWLIELEETQAEQKRIQEIKDSLPDYVAKRAFQNYGDYSYPYGFKCHWILENYEMTQYDDGSWFLKVGVTITNAFGAKVDAIAEAYIDNTNQRVSNFKVYDIH